MDFSQEMLFAIFSMIALTSAGGVALSSSRRTTALFLWCCGMAVGGVYLAVGAEFLAVVQWLLAILIGLTVVFYSVLFEKPELRPRGAAEWVYVSGLLLGVLAIFATKGYQSIESLSVIHEPKTVPLRGIGRELLYRHPLAIEILGLTVFLSVVGVGVISRAETKRK